MLKRVVQKTPEAARLESDPYFSARTVLKIMEGIALSRIIIFFKEREKSKIKTIKIKKRGININLPMLSKAIVFHFIFL